LLVAHSYPDPRIVRASADSGKSRNI
jgi:hypothetical protein